MGAVSCTQKVYRRQPGEMLGSMIVPDLSCLLSLLTYWDAVLHRFSRWFAVSNWFFKLRQSAGTIVAIAISHGNLGMFQPSCLPGLSVLELGLLGREPMSYLSCREIPSLCKHVSTA